jgi:hypothetical protein
MLPSDMNLNIKTNVSGYNNEILISWRGFNLGLNTRINHLTTHKTKEKVDVIQNRKQKPHIKTTTDTTGVTQNEKQEEKLALILFLTIGFVSWRMFTKTL